MRETRTIQCPECRGMGDCPTCDGTGKVEAARTADRPSLRAAAEYALDAMVRQGWDSSAIPRLTQSVAALRQALEDQEARQRHVPGAIDIFDLVCSCGWRQSKQADPDEDWWVHVTSEREFAFRPSTGSEEGGPTRVE